MSEMILTYKYRLLPNKAQHHALAAICEDQRQLYNAALEERIDYYRKVGKSLSYFRQALGLRECRRALPEMAALPANLQRGTLKRIDTAFQGFFARVKRGDKPGFPRFRGKWWVRSFEFAEFSGIAFDGRRIRLKGFPGGLRVHLHRPMPTGKICSAQFKRDGSGWAICFAIKIAVPEKVTVHNVVGVDVGLKTLAYLSDGTAIPNPRIAKKAEHELRRRQRAVTRCKRGSNRRRKVRARLAAAYCVVSNMRKAHLHQVSARMAKDYDLIAVEDLNVKGLARAWLAKPIHDASWSTLIEMIAYKAERAGKYLIKVDARNTTQACSGCGAIVPKTLAVREHNCPHCGLVLDRDENAARNVLRKGVLALDALNVARWGERAHGNIALEGIPQ